MPRTRVREAGESGGGAGTKQRVAGNTSLFTATEVGHIVHDLCTFNIVS
jgi:hypothetical protein